MLDSLLANEIARQLALQQIAIMICIREMKDVYQSALFCKQRNNQSDSGTKFEPLLARAGRPLDARAMFQNLWDIIAGIGGQVCALAFGSMTGLCPSS